MSQFQQPQQEQQPLMVDPSTVTNHAPSHHSNGSFGTVFIVLAAIIIVAGFACFLGRFCSKRLPKQKPKQNVNPPNHRPKQRDMEFHQKEGDIEFGFGKKVPPGKPVSNGGGKGFRPCENGEKRGEVKSKSSSHVELKVGA